MSHERNPDEPRPQLIEKWDDGEWSFNGDHPWGFAVWAIFTVLFILLIPAFWEIYVALAGGFMLFYWYLKKSTT